MDASNKPPEEYVRAMLADLYIVRDHVTGETFRPRDAQEAINRIEYKLGGLLPPVHCTITIDLRNAILQAGTKPLPQQ